LTIRKHTFAVIGLVVVSFGLHFAWFGYPKTTVFDEVHFGKYVIRSRRSTT
jgi:dolichyl-phosphate-mannose--protein O-mannosyl transferase